MGRQKLRLTPKNAQLQDLDAIKANIIDGYKLSQKLEDKKVKLLAIQSHFLNGFNQNECVQYAALEFGVQQAYAYRLVAQTIEIFGDLNKTNKEVYRHLITERLTVIMRESKEQKDIETELRAIALLSKVQGLDAIKGEDANLLIPVLPSTVVFTTNPSALEEVEEATYEEQ